MTSSTPTTCSIETCVQQGVALKECTCEDNKHQSLMNKWQDDGTQDPQGAHVTTIDLDSNS